MNNSSLIYKINSSDNVGVALEEISAGYSADGVTVKEKIPFGHKVALYNIKQGDRVVKYGFPIGYATTDICAGCHIHDHNLKTLIDGELTYSYNGENLYNPTKSDRTFKGYIRNDGKVGIRNEIWVITTVGCVSKTAQQLASIGNTIIGDGCDGVFAYTHPFGCSQLGDDQENTRKILAGLIKHPNAGGVLVVSLGCENSNAEIIKSYLGDYDKDRIKFLVTQEVEDEIKAGTELIKKLYETIKNDKRTACNVDRLVVGYKCGGSDAFSGITANSLCGRVNDKLCSVGATTILTETPEMFGAEQILLDRCIKRDVFNRLSNMLNGFKQYFKSNGESTSENPSPGNHEGGITTLEEKSLGCVQKGGKALVCDVLSYGDQVVKNGFNILDGPGNDIVSITNLVCAGAQIVLFTTGRGTPLGGPVPTLKISSNSKLFSKKKNWIDFDAGDMSNNEDCLLTLLLDVANGKKTKNEQNGYREISIFKNGVVL